ncbi:hypothetical protein [Sulfitobacter sp. 1A15299]|uniref:hypothetical protein n=1 Tax=Sulfitobacter sp. 1A15299 TaxID=3368598 RepID=UPI0037469D13
MKLLLWERRRIYSLGIEKRAFPGALIAANGVVTWRYFLTIQSVLVRSASDDPALELTNSFFHRHGEAMLNAAALLGGPGAHRRCLRLFVNIEKATVFSKAL